MNNREIIEKYYQQHRDELLSYVGSRLGESDMAEDIVQEVFLKLLCQQEPIIEATLPALTHKLCRYHAIDWFRRHANHEEGEHLLAHTSALGDSAESLLSVHDITMQLEHCLARLPEDWREFYRMHIYGGMKTADICEATGQKYKAVEYRLGLARKQIRNYLRHIS